MYPDIGATYAVKSDTETLTVKTRTPGAEGDNLSHRVNARVCSACNRQLDRFAKYLFKGCPQFSPNGPNVWVFGKAPKLGPLVGKIDSDSLGEGHL